MTVAEGFRIGGAFVAGIGVCSIIYEGRFKAEWRDFTARALRAACEVYHKQMVDRGPWAHREAMAAAFATCVTTAETYGRRRMPR